MTSCSDDAQGHSELTQVQLLGQDLLNVLLAFHRKASVRHHDMNTLVIGVVQNVTTKGLNIVLIKDVAISFPAADPIMRLKGLG